MSAKGATLIELVVGLAVASMIATIALAFLSLAGIAASRQLVAAREEDAAWLALAAIARDLRLSATWSGCIGKPTCTVKSAHGAASVLWLGHAIWFAEDGLKRCPRANKTIGQCEGYLRGIAQVEFFGYVPTPGGGVRRESLTERNGMAARAIDVVLWTSDGRRYARTTARSAHAP
ncbi:pilus assembly FimT family protein [Luteibacter yeojuensis]|uniref:Prepilin-type N-terminal cleavage/methylation domain-containing protein n=1 Tax=Luteibacter yeojuensis TaxID=345309 RepID=A0A7X5QS06_9GAMM|nr:hypothetical protein [Luteibacter yeojuensis]NID14304.1 hypothetical protein [Luteibacter yeojuensis]